MPPRDWALVLAALALECLAVVLIVRALARPFLP